MRANEFIVEYKQYPTQEFEGVSFTMVEEDGFLTVKALNDFGISMASVIFSMDDKELDPQALRVDEKYRGQGIARVMYDYVKSRGFIINRSYDQTDDGKHFWDKHRGEDVRVWEDSVNEYVNADTVKLGFRNSKVVGDILLTAEGSEADGSNRLHVRALDNETKEELGWVDFAVRKRAEDGEPYLRAGFVYVSPESRGKGIAKMMYQYANTLGNDILPSDNQTDMGKAMWSKLDKTVKKPNAIKKPEASPTIQGYKKPSILDRIKKHFN